MIQMITGEAKRKEEKLKTLDECTSHTVGGELAKEHLQGLFNCSYDIKKIFF